MVLWVVLGALYLGPVIAVYWLPISYDFAVTMEPPYPAWLGYAVVVLVLAMPPVVLAFATWRWFERWRA